MFHRAPRRRLIALLLLAAGAMVCRVPAVWHSHGGGRNRHAHENPHPTSGQSHAHRHGPGGHSHSHGEHGHHPGGHSHSGRHSHAFDNSHSDHATASADSGWHMHFSLFGFEFTFRAPFEPDADEPLLSVRRTDTEVQQADAPRSVRWKARALSCVSEWSGPPERVARMGGIETGPLLVRYTMPDTESASRVLIAAVPLSSRDAEAPPVPPPRGA